MTKITTPGTSAQATQESPFKKKPASSASSKMGPIFPSLDEGLKAMDRNFCFVRVANVVVRLQDFAVFDPKTFSSTQYRDLRYVDSDEDGNESEEPLAPVWLTSPYRNQRDRLTYAPGSKLYLNDALNIWRPFEVEPKKGSVEPWAQLGEFLFPDAAEFAYLESWFAYPLQHPGAKIFVVPVLFSPTQGIGKNILIEAVEGIYGPNAAQITLSRLESDFNPWQKAKQLIVGNEIRKSKDRGALYDKVKDLVTAPKQWINEKYKGEYELPNVANFIFTTNNENAFYLDDADRRFYVPTIRNAQPLPGEFYKNFRKWKNSEEGKAALYYHLLHLDVGDFDPRDRAPASAAKAEIIAMGWNAAERWARQLLDNIGALTPKNGEVTLFTMEELLRLFNNPMYSEHGLSQALKRAGFQKAYKGNQVRLGAGKKPLWVIASPEESMRYWVMSEGELRGEYHRQRCPIHNGAAPNQGATCHCEEVCLA